MFESKINKGRANGYTPLDSGSKVPLSYLPPIQSTIDTGSFATTSSLQTIIDVTGSFVTTTSFNEYTASVNIDTTSFATTGSNSFDGNQTITGSLNVNGPLTISVLNGVPSGVANWDGQGGWNQGSYSDLATTGGTGTGLTVDVAAAGAGYINIEAITINNPGSGYTNGDVITIDNENNLPGTFTIEVGTSSLQFDVSGSLVFPDSTTQTTAFIPTTFVTTSSFNSFTSSLSGVISGSSQLTTSFPSKTIGSWSVPVGSSVQSFTVDANNSYTMWVNGNIPNGIITWNAMATISNTNVPVIGTQYGWYYELGNELVLTSMPDQFVGTSGSILITPSGYVPNTSNVFNFGITNNSEEVQTINYGYIKLS
jgi:hypothetical protein